MKSTEHASLEKLFTVAQKGSKPFRDDSTRPYLEILTELASQCKVVTELGINTGCATLAFLMSGCKKVYSYNVVMSPNALKVQEAARLDGARFRLVNRDDLKTRIKKTDLLFIDTDHWYGRIKTELYHHQGRVRRWIVMNNTETFGTVNPFDGRPGMKPAIYEFLEEHPQWQLKEHYDHGHGLTLLERQ